MTPVNLQDWTQSQEAYTTIMGLAGQAANFFKPGVAQLSYSPPDHPWIKRFIAINLSEGQEGGEDEKTLMVGFVSSNDELVYILAFTRREEINDPQKVDGPRMATVVELVRPSLDTADHLVALLTDAIED